jgi:protein TonB
MWLGCLGGGLEYQVHTVQALDQKLGCAMCASLVVHAAVVFAAVALGLLLVSPAYEYPVVMQEVFLASLGGDGTPGGAASAQAEPATAAVPSESAVVAASEPPKEITTRSRPEVRREKPQARPSSQTQAPAKVPSESQAAGSGDAGPQSQGSGTAAQGQGSGGGNGPGRYEGEFGSGNGPRFAKRVEPRYPVQARKFGKEGVVVLLLIIDESGRLKTAEIVEKAGAGFDEEALDAVKSSSYLPATVEGRAVPSRAMLRVRFQLAAS